MEFENRDGMREVFVRFIRKKNGEIVYPKNAKFFHFWVRDNGVRGHAYEQLSLFDENKK